MITFARRLGSKNKKKRVRVASPMQASYFATSIICSVYPKESEGHTFYCSDRYSAKGGLIFLS